MTVNTRFRTLRGWDVAVGAVILVVVLLGWFTAAGSSDAGARCPMHSVAHIARLPR